VSGIFDLLAHLPSADKEELDRWVHSKGRLVFTRLISELNAGLTGAMADLEIDNLEQYALSMARRSGERKGVTQVGRYLNVTLPKYYKDQKEKESGGE
jgi:hypothetical protein